MDYNPAHGRKGRGNGFHIVEVRGEIRRGGEKVQVHGYRGAVCLLLSVKVRDRDGVWRREKKYAIGQGMRVA